MSTLKIISLFLTMMLGFFLLVQLHENVHVQIYKSYDIDSYVSWFQDFPDASTTPTKDCPTDNCVLANNINEIVGYTAIALYIGLCSFILVLNVGEDK